KVSALYQRTHTDGLHEAVDLPGLGDLQQNYLPGVGGDQRTVQAYSATGTYRFGDVELTSVTGYNVNHDVNTLDYRFVFGPIVQPTFGVNGATFYYDLAHHKFVQEVRVAGSAGKRVDWRVGTFFTNEHEFRPTPSRVDAIDTDTFQTVGVYWYLSTQYW